MDAEASHSTGDFFWGVARRCFEQFFAQHVCRMLKCHIPTKDEHCESTWSLLQRDDCEKRRHLGSAHRRSSSVCHAAALGQALQSEGTRWGWLLFTLIIGAFLQPASSRESERMMPARPPSSLFLAKSAHLYVQDALRVQQMQFYLGCAHAFGGSQSGGDCVRAQSVHAKDWESSELVDVGARGVRRLLQDADQKSAAAGSNNNTNLIIILSVCIPVGVIFLMVGVWCVVYRRLPDSPDHQNSSSKQPPNIEGAGKAQPEDTTRRNSSVSAEMVFASAKPNGSSDPPMGPGHSAIIIPAHELKTSSPICFLGEQQQIGLGPVFADAKKKHSSSSLPSARIPENQNQKAPVHDTRSAAPPPLSPVVWGASDLLQEQRLHQKPLTWQQQHQQQQQQPALAELAVPQPSAGEADGPAAARSSLATHPSAVPPALQLLTLTGDENLAEDTDDDSKRPQNSHQLASLAQQDYQHTSRTVGERYVGPAGQRNAPAHNTPTHNTHTHPRSSTTAHPPIHATTHPPTPGLNMPRVLSHRTPSGARGTSISIRAHAEGHRDPLPPPEIDNRERGFSVGQEQAPETRPRQLPDSATTRQLPDLPPSASRAASSVTIDDTYMMQLMGLAPAEEEHRHSIAKGPGLYSGYGYTPRDGNNAPRTSKDARLHSSTSARTSTSRPQYSHSRSGAQDSFYDSDSDREGSVTSFNSDYSRRSDDSFSARSGMRNGFRTRAAAKPIGSYPSRRRIMDLHKEVFKNGENGGMSMATPVELPGDKGVSFYQGRNSLHGRMHHQSIENAANQFRERPPPVDQVIRDEDEVWG